MDADVYVTLGGQLCGEAAEEVGGGEGEGAACGGEVHHLEGRGGGLGGSHTDKLLERGVECAAVDQHWAASLARSSWTSGVICSACRSSSHSASRSRSAFGTVSLPRALRTSLAFKGSTNTASI